MSSRQAGSSTVSRSNRPSAVCSVAAAALGRQRGSKRPKSASLNHEEPSCEKTRKARSERLGVHRAQASRPSKWPVTPEVAGSSPIAPVGESLQIELAFAYLGKRLGAIWGERIGPRPEASESGAFSFARPLVGA